MTFKNVIVTGANRGIGLEFVRQLLKQNNSPKNLIATTRKQSPELDSLKSAHNNLHVLTYDATNYDSYGDFVKQVESIVKNEGLNLLINNAGMAIRSTLDNVTPKDILTNVEVNAVGSLMLTKALLPLLKASAAAGQKTLVANISSAMGSIDDNGSGGSYAYRASKVTMNMFTKSLSVDLKSDNIIVMTLHPGWVQTDMGGPNALINTETSATGLLDVFNKADMSYTGKFLDWAGKERKW
ncbi:hypothetical protein DERF_000009 [Dermatophagoides farinae]|uniref:Short chain dehydrogenase/reductase family oxidoreductase-like protein n=1 Tax=Dermatophagoides farinae TaxID=6954 RepID=A0A922I943_DERFA|nr:C-factor-like [Dermatophagoides farinae]KAH7640446.1 short chain dehydrogenase/reductase family oxidoreductase-like protein [Dermatophagoides farinae]KAH9525876.1 hypothetical protein DERF_000009 [Dermatophagoides farinae]